MLSYFHPRTGRRSAILRELYTLCTPEERKLSAAFYASYAAARGAAGLTPFAGIRQAPASNPAVPDGAGAASLAVGLLAGIDLNGEIAVAVSGGIDCWVLAALLQARGSRVRGWCLRSDVPGYCEWPQTQRMAAALDIPCDPIRVTADDFVAALPAFIALTETPVYNLHPVSKLLLAQGLAARGVRTVVSGDGADQVMRHERDCDLLPLTQTCFRATGVTLLTPYLNQAVIAWCRRPYPDKQPVRELACHLGVPAVPKRPTFFPDLPLPSHPRAALPGIDHDCLSYTTGLLLEILEEHALCAASPG